MQPLALNFLGDLSVTRQGELLPLPPSRKTRALLAYLALNPRSFRRDYLCELLWEVPDDPRGSLRWSLSKLRRLVDDADCQRIVADRSHVSFAAEGVSIDALALRALIAKDLSTIPLDDAWCVAEREHTTRAQTALLTEIVQRRQDAPEDALPFARSLATIAPYSESDRASLIRLLVATGRTEEAKQQYALGARMLQEAGAQPTGALARALESARAAAEPAATGRSAPAERRAKRIASDAAEVFGRRAELLQLAGTIESAIEGSEARVLLLRGEPGIGKSRLLRAAADFASRAGAWVLEACAYESESIRPFAIWIDALRQASAEDAARIFGVREGDNRERLLAGLSDLLGTRARGQPVVLLFDDLQWCDESSATALHYVMRTNRQMPVVAIVAARESEIQDNSACQQALAGIRHSRLLTEIALEPLSTDAVRQLIETQAPGVDSKRLAAECGGNPLMAIELARAELSGDEGLSLRELIRERLARLDVDAAELIRWAALLAPRVDIAMLERLTGTDAAAIGRALELAEQQGILQPSEAGYRFSHALVAQCVYSDISPARRRLMHRRVAELLEQATALELEHAADLAHHASQSGDAALAARAMVSAGRLCLRFYANDEALARAQRGLRFAAQLPEGERIRLTIELKDIMLEAAPLDDWEAAAEEYIALAEQALDHGALSHARRGYYMASTVRWLHGQWTGAREEVLQSERVSRGGSDEEHVVGMAEAARCLALLERDLNHADAMLMEAQALASRRRVVHQSLPAALGMLRFHQNQFDEAEELLNQARTLAKSSGDRHSEYQANEYLVMIAIERGDMATGKTRCEALADIGSRLRSGSEAPFARALAAICASALGENAAGLEPALDELRQVDAKHRLAYALTKAATLDLEHDRVGLAIERGEEALANAEILERATDMLLARLVLAQAYRAQGDPEAFDRQRLAIGEFEPGRVAEWARARAAEELA
jgi:DNA-binding SARP family transcriptional activator